MVMARLPSIVMVAGVLLSATSLLAAEGASASQAATQSSYDPWTVGKVDLDRADVIYSDAIPTPHRKWAKPYYQGKVKALLVPDLITGREVAELAQRMDLEYDTVSIVQQGDVTTWGLGDLLKERGKGMSGPYAVLEARLAEKPYEVMVMAGFNWGILPAKLQDRILKSVQEGMGLVLVAAPQTGKEPLPEAVRDLLVLNGATDDPKGKGPWAPSGRHYITDGLPIEAVSKAVENSVYAFKEIRGGQPILVGPGDLPVLTCKEVGKGRVCVYGYKGTWAVASFTPASSGAMYEYFYSMLAKSILWAARKDAPVSAVELGGGSTKLAVAFSTKMELKGPQVELTLWDAENNLVHREAKPVKPADPCVVSFDRPEKLDGGWHFATFTLRDEGKVINWWTTAFEIPRDVTVEKVEAVKAANGEVTGSVILGGEGKAASTLEIELLDNYERVMDRKVQDVPTGKQPPCEFRFRTDGVVSILAHVRATVRQDGRRVHRIAASQPIIVAPPQDPNAFLVGSYGRMTTSFRDYLFPTYYARLKEIGIDRVLPSGESTIRTGYQYDMDFKASASIGHPWLGFYAQDKKPFTDAMDAFKKTKDKKYLVRTSGCLNDPAVLEKMKAKLVAALAPKLPFGRHLWDVGGECSLTSYRDAADFCFCEMCLKGFRTWLKQQYPSLEAINASWGTAHATWEDVVPMTTEEVLEHYKTAHSFGPWADHRTYMEVVWAETFRKIDAWVKELDPAGGISVNGSQSTSVHNGNDWWRLDSILSGVEPYNVGAQYELHRSFNPNMKLTLWTGYGARGVGASYGIWYGVLHGFRGANIFWDYEMLNPDYTCAQSGRDIGKTLQEIKSVGIGYLLNSSQREDDPVAVLYSVASVHGDYIHQKAAGAWMRTDHISALSGVCSLIAESGYQFRVISYEQLASGELQKKGYKVLALPSSVAMSQAQVDAIDAFVKAGGTLMAWPVPGIMDEHGKMYDKPPVLEILGVQAKKGAAKFEAVKGAPSLDVKSSGLISAPYEQPWDWSTEPTTAKVLATAEYFKHPMPLVTCNERGKGKAYYLTCRTSEMDRTLEFNAKLGRNDELKKYLIGLVNQACADAGLVKRMAIANADGSQTDLYASYFFRRGGIQYNILLPQFRGETTTGADGVTYTKDAEGNAGQTYRVSFSRAWHVYEVRQGKYLGQVKQFDEAVAFGSPRIYACLPYKVEAVKVSAPDQPVRQGQPAEISISLAVAGAASSEDHVARVTVTTPSGQSAPYLGKALSLAKGAGRLKLPMALNDPVGRWKVEVTDVSTGQKGAASFEVKP